MYSDLKLMYPGLEPPSWYVTACGGTIVACSNGLSGFAGIITAVAAWGIWGGDMFPAESDPSGSMDHPPSACEVMSLSVIGPENWTVEEMRRWLRNVSCPLPRTLPSANPSLANSKRKKTS